MLIDRLSFLYLVKKVGRKKKSFFFLLFFLVDIRVLVFLVLFNSYLDLDLLDIYTQM